MLGTFKLSLTLLFCSQFCAVVARRCLEGGAGRKRVSVVQGAGGSSVKREKYMQIHNSLNYDSCPGDACRCCSYYYNVTGGTADQLEEYCVSWTSSSSKNCVDETPNNVQGSYKMKTTSCDPKVDDACNFCFEGFKPVSNDAKSRLTLHEVVVLFVLLNIMFL